MRGRGRPRKATRAGTYEGMPFVQSFAPAFRDQVWETLARYELLRIVARRRLVAVLAARPVAAVP